MEDTTNYYAVILAGGGGTRLWPKSRKNYPKHLLKLFGDRTMLQQTYDRILPLIPKERIFLITLGGYVKAIKEQLPDLPRDQIITEPQGKNTALAMGIASAYIRSKNQQAVIINLAADQLIENEELFRKTVKKALDVAAAGDYIVAIGIRPTYPHTGLGYIHTGQTVDQDFGEEKDLAVFNCEGFKEKPDLATAESFLASGQYLWNANLYCWSVDTVNKAFALHAPTLSQEIEEVYQALGTEKEGTTINDVYQKAENVQIDIAVSEKAKNMLVIPGDFGWSDIGDWKVIYETHSKDNEGNVVDVEDDLFINIDCKNCLIEGSGRVIAAIGLENFVIIDTKEALLICNQNKTQDVKKVIEKLKEKKLDKYL